MSGSQPANTLAVIDANNNTQYANVVINSTTGAYSPRVVVEVAGAPATQANPSPVADSGAIALLGSIAANTNPDFGITPVAPSGALILAQAATSQVLAATGTATGGGRVLNPLSATQQGIGTAESAFVNFTGAAATLTAGGQSFEIQPGGTLDLPTGLTTAVTWNAATVGHKLTAVIF